MSAEFFCHASQDDWWLLHRKCQVSIYVFEKTVLESITILWYCEIQFGGYVCIHLCLLCLGFASVDVSWGLLLSISTCWMPSLPGPSTRGFFVCKSLSLLPSDLRSNVQGTSKALLRKWMFQSDPASSWLNFLSAGTTLLLIALSKQLKILPYVSTKDRCSCNNKGS